MPRGPVHSPPPGTSKRVGGRKAFETTAAVCEPCNGGHPDRPCTCVVQDRCGDTNDRGHQCIRGVGHTLQHVTAAGKFWA